MKKIKFKSVNINFILMMIVVILLAFFAFFMWKISKAVETELLELKSSITNTMNQDEIGDVEGYGLIVSGIGYGMGTFGVALMQVLLVFIPILYVIYLFIFSVIARIVYAPSKGRLLAYRILMGFDYAGIISLIVCIFSFFSASDSVSSFIKIIVLELFLLLILFFNIRNTYSGRIKN